MLTHEDEQLVALARNLAPILVDHRVERLSADQGLVHQRAHRVDDGQARFRSRCGGAGEGDVPAHAIAGDGDDLEGVAVDAQIIGVGAGVDQRRGVVAAGVDGVGIALGCIQLADQRLPLLAAIAVHHVDEVALVGMVARQIAELGLVIGAPPGTDGERAAARHARPFTRSSAAATMPSALGRVAA